ncbi:MAG: hypothetical protein U1F16_12670 [Turneriella sp.]
MRFLYLALSFVLLATSVTALPQYTAREGRICDSCHAYPFETEKQKAWKDPELAGRKCNLSCATCHVDPGGGGMRTVAGRYLANAALPVFNNEIRPWHDQDRNISDLIRWLSEDAPSAPAQPPQRPVSETSVTPAPEPVTDNRPAKFHTHEIPPAYSLSDPTVFGVAHPGAAGERRYSPEFGIYGRLNADPKLQIGGDMRLAYVKTDTVNALFPMQFDIGARYHPFEHWTFATTWGLVGQAASGSAARSRSASEMYTIRNAYIMYHELPYQLFFRGGLFQPTFGVRQEDHTAPVRQNFEMDLSRKYSAVLGAEAGFAANYPYLTVSAFTNNGGRAIGDQNQDFTVNPQGLGSAVNAGWRDLLWGAGASFMTKSRSAAYGGNLTAFSTDAYLNLGRIWLKFPLTILGEYAFGNYSSPGTPSRNFAANFFELNYLLFNGVNVKTNHHFYDADLSQRGNESGRFGLGVELIPITIMKLYIEYRVPWRVTASQIKSDGLVNPFDWLGDKQFVFIGHVYF